MNHKDQTTINMLALHGRMIGTSTTMEGKYWVCDGKVWFVYDSGPYTGAKTVLVGDYFEFLNRVRKGAVGAKLVKELQQ